ncbi:hypothetical protein SAMN05444161_2204 [Rhizobiales bacterium GAS191]|jgi:hypothetical protein|nr:hypothetical protein SAMN05519103_01317 [Rhizobiales bacterium GAS113]SEC29934.1 hypothetical protein SAMN05519104_1116 [Rhizobiales bacterium GAS188]SEC96233.1 hypothetical protein SAMN05444161_2204 [Rhizobiales bacterium GAS191]
MASFQSQHDHDGQNTISALGLRWAALRGMLASPLINAEDQRSLRDELLQEIRSIGQMMSGIAARNAIEICAKIDVMSEELKKAEGADDYPTETLLASIRSDVMAMSPRTVTERSNVQIVRGAVPHRSVETAPGDATRGEVGKSL